MNYNLVIVGGGPAGLAAAVAAYDSGQRSILILERGEALGGILNQCIHSGFGLHTFNEELTGPEYAARFIDMVKERGIEYRLNATVIDVSPNKSVTFVSKNEGLKEVEAKAVILALGCRERPRGAINIAGTRPAGIFSAGTAQRLINIEGYMVGKEVVILGSGDIGLIMARRMTFEGARVLAVLELMPYSTGLTRNIVTCLDDFNIPLLLSHTVIEVLGKQRIEGVVVAEVDDNLKPILSTKRTIPCDTLLLSVGLLPENELAKRAGVTLSKTTSGAIVDDNYMTSVEGIFECGNALHVHDLVDFVSKESQRAAQCAVEYINNTQGGKQKIEIKVGKGVRYCVPQLINRDQTGQPLDLRLRVDGVYRDCSIRVCCDGQQIAIKRRPIMTAGEMESIELNPQQASALKGGQSITVSVEGIE